MIGLGSSESTCGVKFVKNEFYPGEPIDIWTDCDNTKCGNNVKKMKCKLFRSLSCRDANTGKYVTYNKLVR